MTTLYVDNIAPNLQSKISAPNLTLPAGSVVQVVREFVSNVPSPIAVSTSAFTPSGVTASITPTKNNSLILIDFTVSMADGTSDALTGRMYYKIGTGSYQILDGGGNYQIAYASGTTARYAPIAFGGKLTATSTDAITVQPYIRSASGGTARLAHSAASYALTLTEVAQ